MSAPQTADAPVADPALDLAAWGGRLQAYRGDCWRWIRECVWTKDEADAAEPLKPFPVAVCLPCRRYLGAREADQGCRQGVEHPRQPLRYLEYVIRGWQRGQPTSFPDPILAFPKPRRMRMSWAMVAAHLWLTMFRTYAAVFIVSSKEEKSGELVDRAAHILRMLSERGRLAVGAGPDVDGAREAPAARLPEARLGALRGGGGGGPAPAVHGDGDPGGRGSDLEVAAGDLHGDAVLRGGRRADHAGLLRLPGLLAGAGLRGADGVTCCERWPPRWWWLRVARPDSGPGST
jgi:hypothetical protein